MFLAMIIGKIAQQSVKAKELLGSKLKDKDCVFSIFVFHSEH